MSYELVGGKMIAKSVEYSAAYHCNLRCAGCSHLSPFVRRQFPSLTSFRRDLEALGRALHVGVIRILGGEPLLNPGIDDFLHVARESCIADRVMVTTNGILLHRMSSRFWENIDLLLITAYPGVDISAERGTLSALAKEHGVEVSIQPMPTFRTTITTDVQPRDWVTDTIFRSCKDAHEYHCHMIHEGWLYKCAVPPFLPQYLDRLGGAAYDPSADGLNIHASSDLFTDLQAFLISGSTPESCRHCLGYLGRSRPHHELSREAVRDPRRLGVTRQGHLDRLLLMGAMASAQVTSTTTAD